MDGPEREDRTVKRKLGRAGGIRNVPWGGATRGFMGPEKMGNLRGDERCACQGLYELPTGETPWLGRNLSAVVSENSAPGFEGRFTIFCPRPLECRIASSDGK